MLDALKVVEHGRGIDASFSYAAIPNRAWIEFASALLGSIAAFYSAPHDAAVEAKAREIRARLESL